MEESTVSDAPDCRSIRMTVSVLNSRLTESYMVNFNTNA